MVNNWVRLCEACGVSASALYCHTHSAYLCSACDARIHGAISWPHHHHHHHHHHRVPVCEACEHAPSAFSCNANAASLCIACDLEIHAANPIAARHHRLPLSLSPLSHPHPHPHHHQPLDGAGCYDYEYESSREMEAQREVDSWLLLDSDTQDLTPTDLHHHHDGSVFHEAADDDDDDDTKFQRQRQHHRHQQQKPFSFSEDIIVDNINERDDSIVPVQSVEADQPQQPRQQNVYFDMKPQEREPPANHPSNYFQSVPMLPFVDFRRATISDISSYRFTGGIQIFPNPSFSNSLQLHFGDHLQMNRKAGVLKYREKKKSRKFEKRIRYVYRKAYAEKRPRVKGRFVKREDLTSEGPLPLN